MPRLRSGFPLFPTQCKAQVLSMQWANDGFLGAQDTLNLCMNSFSEFWKQSLQFDLFNRQDDKAWRHKVVYLSDKVLVLAGNSVLKHTVGLINVE